ncbi:snare associated Golgi protein-domain-containing protein [Mycena sp. CBHHK59/15]|nr:snare associated Golgi protein-domain-containing protein [Mycena sp. CBHHK59/15]
MRSGIGGLRGQTACMWHPDLIASSLSHLARGRRETIPVDGKGLWRDGTVAFFPHPRAVLAILPEYVTNLSFYSLKFGWLVPIGVLFVISFPPLFGHEIVAILCGLVWGLWIGFAIVSAGTFLGEVGNFYAFKYCCRARGEKMERTKIPYACLARCVRTGGFKIALIARFSAIPGHFTTAVFSTCGMSIWVFSIAAILSLPKQFITVYLGVILEQSSEGHTDPKSRIISDSVLAVTFLVTILAMWYILRQMAVQKPLVIYERRKARQGKLARVDLPIYVNPNDSDSSVSSFNPRASLSDIPLTAKASVHPRYDYEQQQKQRQYREWGQQRQQTYDAPQHQQWDAHGRAVGYTPGPAPSVMYAPQPAHSGRAEIRPGAYVEGLAHERARQQTSDEVGWEMGGVQMRDTGAAPSRAQQYQQQYQQQQQYAQHQEQQYEQPPQQQQYEPHQQQQQEPATPTQAQYATYQPQPGAGGLGTGPLPTPSYPSPFDDPPHAQHGVEPTGVSYHTAYGASESDDTHDPPAQALGVRAFSPPPPSYRTDARR